MMKRLQLITNKQKNYLQEIFLYSPKYTKKPDETGRPHKFGYQRVYWIWSIVHFLKGNYNYKIIAQELG